MDNVSYAITFAIAAAGAGFAALIVAVVTRGADAKRLTAPTAKRVGA